MRRSQDPIAMPVLRLLPTEGYHQRNAGQHLL